ncbi:MAG: hypothetical protein MK085_12050 [Phycisphaerales bacterium]|nr:hypothetical protein [Phycisphaerales bacterium]
MLSRTSISCLSLARCLAVLAACLVAITAISSTVSASAAPSVAADEWELEFTPGPLRLYVDPVDDRAYWYFTYTVANRTERDRMWAPRAELFTDGGDILRSGREVPSRVNKQLKTLLNDPLLEDQNRIIGEILVGRENAKSGVVVWPASDLEVTEVTLFMTGLSSDSKVVDHPETGKPVRLRKTLRREYLVPGNPMARGSDPLPLQAKKNRRGPDCELEFPSGGCWIYR